MYRCFRVSICHFCRTVLRSRCLNRGTVTRIPIRQIYRGKGGGISVFTTPQSAEVFVASLHENERELLREALRITPYNQAEENSRNESSAPPSVSQLRLVAFHSAVPFIGFGLLDNAIMIIAGEYIDYTIGMTLGISTMAAAALGNIVSDVSGIGLAHYVEAATNRLGFQSPKLSSNQAEMPRTRFVTNLGRAFGIVVGCFVGMFPLLFYGDKEEQEEKDSRKTIGFSIVFFFIPSGPVISSLYQSLR